MKRRKLWDNLNIGENILVLTEKVKRNSAPGKFYKHSRKDIYEKTNDQ